VPITVRVHVENLLIIGGGPAGYSAAIYASRAKLEPVCVEGYGAGGQLLTTTRVENYPGFPEGVDGPELVALFRAQAERFGARFELADVTEVDLARRPFRVVTTSGEHYTRALIVATGATARRLGLPSEEALDNKGVAYCAVCDGAMFPGQRILVVGGGDAALEEAMTLTSYASEVVVVHRRREFRASKVMQDYAHAKDGLDFLQPYVIEEILGVEQNRVRGAILRNTETGELREEECGAVFIAIGRDPNTEMLLPWLDHDEHGYLRVQPGTTHTNVDGVFAAGDVADPVYRQAVTSAGSGCQAALDAERWLNHHAAEEPADVARAA
jgi:thioredoxin reductase (NADPH)